MKAVRIHEHGGPEILRWEDISDLKCPSDKVLVQIKAASINHLDLWVRKGFRGIPLPMIMGSDGVGIIVETGEKVEGWSSGDEVIIQPGIYCGSCTFCKQGRENYCLHFGILGETQDGTQCEFMIIDSDHLAQKPELISYEAAAAFPLVFLTAHNMLIRRAKIEQGEVVLVLGAGSGVGSAAIQIAKYIGCFVIATAGSEEKLHLAKKMGADDCINHSKEKIYRRVKELTEGLGADVIVEHVGLATWASSLRSLARGGRLVRVC